MSTGPTGTRPGADVRKQGGFTLIELLVTVAVIGVVAAMAIPALLTARIAANESAAIGSLRAINGAQASYHATAGGGYAVLLSTLSVGCPGTTQGYLSADLINDPAVKSGYTVAIQAANGAVAERDDCNGTQTYSGFYSTAVPIATSRTGRRGFASNTGASIFFDPTGAAPSEASMRAGGGAQPLQ